MLQGDILETLSLIVAVQFLKLAVEDFSKLLQILRSLRELDKPLMTTFRILVHEDRSSRIFKHLGACHLTSVFQALLRIINDEFLTKGIDE